MVKNMYKQHNMLLGAKHVRLISMLAEERVYSLFIVEGQLGLFL